MKIPGNTDAEKMLIKAYIAVEAVLLIAIQANRIMHFTRLGVIGYPAIVINTAVAAYFFAKYGRTLRDRSANLIACALFVTLIADWFLTFRGARHGTPAYIYGAAAFCLVEILYAAYLKAGTGSVIARAALFAAGLLGLHRAGMLNAESALGILNVILVLVNVIDAWAAKRRDAALMFKLGITLFLLCDITVMMKVVTHGGTRTSLSFMTWLFYVPAQVLLTLSYAEACSDRTGD